LCGRRSTREAFAAVDQEALSAPANGPLKTKSGCLCRPTFGGDFGYGSLAPPPASRCRSWGSVRFRCQGAPSTRSSSRGDVFWRERREPLLPEGCAEGCAGRRGERSSRSSAASHPSSCGGEPQAENGCSSMAAEDLLGGGAAVRAEGRLVALACRGARMLKAATFRFDCDRGQGGCFGRATAQVNSEGSKVSRARCAWEWGARSSGARRVAK